MLHPAEFAVSTNAGRSWVIDIAAVASCAQRIGALIALGKGAAFFSSATILGRHRHIAFPSVDNRRICWTVDCCFFAPASFFAWRRVATHMEVVAKFARCALDEAAAGDLLREGIKSV